MSTSNNFSDGVKDTSNIVDDYLLSVISAATGAETVIRQEMIQQLWSGYGEIVRYDLQGSDSDSVVVKWVSPPTQ